VTFPERLQQPLVGDFLLLEHHQHHFGVTGAARTDLLVGRVRGMTAGVTHGGGIDAVAQFPEFALRAPEAAEPEHGLLQTRGIRRLQPMAVHEMADGRGDRFGTARQRLGCARQCRGFAHEQHGYLPAGCSVEVKKRFA
jgi:hypothetical protein